MKPVTIMVDYRVVQTFLRALDSYVKIHPEDSDAKSVRSMVIETGAIMEVEALVDTLLESETNTDCANCSQKETCKKSDPTLN